ncbi:TetR/AcrR family transcriptional regulator [Microbacterium terrisoli]|uniref:TetR/AcrR family transcriptional regulator n=1 Tax=Microbacterium terrisoli TaxID=3242192 RepID=UPI002805C8BD|nr:helix-turn-helix domain-containing protein [Microbacterium protaetiae]
MARRGAVLRDHILEQAKEAFLEAGFERTSMDAVAARAATSKRSLYAHFATKEVLLLAVLDYVDELFQHRMMTPASYADDPVDAAALYCARFLQMLGWASLTQTCRLGIEVAVQFPDAAARLHEVFFGSTTARLADHVGASYTLDAAAAQSLAGELLGATVYPELPRLLFGLSETRPDVPEIQTLTEDVDVEAIRRQVGVRLAGVAA